MPWRFNISYVPGKTIPAPDATSRNPAQHADVNIDSMDCLAAFRVSSEIDGMEEAVIAAARSTLSRIQAVTWERVRDETGRDIHLLQLADMAEHGFPARIGDLSPQLRQFWNIREDLSIVDGVLLYKDRVVIPPALQQEVCDHLHGAHQGESQMNGRAATTVFWPGITSDIHATRARCQTCNSVTPSQQHLPPAEP